ncbi:hypothetical protein B9Z19DRAFT_993880 [Tuber borchii]|uniref:Uncharacterized protein n=1 Tax=Tuber borchii TaxID=42251 RepID=A0A2T6ZJD6_TUBBO|nr:hypothetical protein B9Z19DRAFT_993880 [Tuber borchii]
MSEKDTSSASTTTSTSTTSTIKSAFQRLLPKKSSTSGQNSSTQPAMSNPAEHKTISQEARIAYLAHKS